MSNAMSYFDNPAAAKKSVKGTTRHIVIGVPTELHNCISEITFRERITFKKYLMEAINDLNDIMDDADGNGINKYEAVGSKSHKITFSADELVHPSVNIPAYLDDTLREVAHYGKKYGIISYRHLVVEILYIHLEKYNERYDDVIAEIMCKN